MINMKDQFGPKNHMWKGGPARSTIRRRAKACLISKGRILNVCEVCHSKSSTNLPVHHIDLNRSNNTAENLIVLCVSCHNNAHSNHGWRRDKLSGRFLRGVHQSAYR